MAALRTSDPALAAVMDRVGAFDLGPRRPAFVALARAIVFQQLATKAATSILQRLLDLYGGEFPTPPQLLATPEGNLRGVGLSERKVEYLRGLATAFLDGSVDGDELAALPDEEVVERLTRLKGIGRWSAEMFLLFCLGRPNVLPVGDLGFRKAVREIYGLP
ncbi:MAG: DNA-3-methyladenine glycosylase family protein, partial [Dehalococcoidia bacterium]